jgi:predicted secreted hydrolase
MNIQTNPHTLNLIDPERDLAFRPDADTNSWFVIGHVQTRDGQKLNFLVHQLQESAPGEPLKFASIFNITDITNSLYKCEERTHRAGEIEIAADRLSVKMPTSEITGSLHHLKVRADFGWGSVDLDAEFPGLVMMNAGSGVFSFVGGLPTAQYSIPSGRGSGTLTLNGATHAFSGNVWFDRQWTFTRDLFGNGSDGTTLQDPGMSWSWMDINLENGDALGLWDVNFHGNQYNWVTVLKPDGTHIVADLTPLAERSSDHWTSPTSGQRYPTRWVVEVRGLDCRLEVRSLIREQEVASDYLPKYEGVAEVSGIYQGKHVTGFTMVEMVGNWRA